MVRCLASVSFGERLERQAICLKPEKT